MKYKIFEIDTKRKSVLDGYEMKTTYHHRLIDLEGEPYRMNTEFSSFEDALLEIKNYSDDLKSKTLTILPVIQIDYEGQL